MASSLETSLVYSFEILPLKVSNNGKAMLNFFSSCSISMGQFSLLQEFDVYLSSTRPYENLTILSTVDLEKKKITTANVFELFIFPLCTSFIVKQIFASKKIRLTAVGLS